MYGISKQFTRNRVKNKKKLFSAFSGFEDQNSVDPVTGHSRLLFLSFFVYYVSSNHSINLKFKKKKKLKDISAGSIAIKEIIMKIYVKGEYRKKYAQNL